MEQTATAISRTASAQSKMKQTATRRTASAQSKMKRIKLVLCDGGVTDLTMTSITFALIFD